MPSPPLDDRISIARKAMVEEALRDGFSPFRVGGGRGSSVMEAARRLQINHRTMNGWIETQTRRAAADKSHFTPDWSLWQAAEGVQAVLDEARPRNVRRYLLTAAQDNTAVHLPFWRNLEAYAAHMGAELMVAPFTYNKSLFEDHATRGGLFAEVLQPHLRYDRVDLGPLVFCAEMNTLPTAVRPLSGLESYTAGRWGVFPHAKIQLVSVPTIGKGATILMTTGAATLPNYIAKKAGLKAEFHHVIGATLVEIDENDRPFCRQINASGDGDFQDLDVRVTRGKVTSGHRVEAITWGDIHREKIDPAVAMGAWGFDVASDSRVPAPGAMIDVLRPRYQFYHDLLDFDARSHHRRDDHHHRFQMICQGTDLVEDGVRSCPRFLRATEREWCRSVVVESNHDNALSKWLKAADFREDVANAEFFLRCQQAVYAAIRTADTEFNVFHWALAELDETGLEGIDFVPETGSFVICQAAGGIECGQHGHLGLNGARGSPQSFTKMATKMNTGHTHSASILDGVYTAGLSGLMDQGYNRGASSWSHSHIVTYASGKRSIITMLDGRWRA